MSPASPTSLHQSRHPPQTSLQPLRGHITCLDPLCKLRGSRTETLLYIHPLLIPLNPTSPHPLAPQTSRRLIGSRYHLPRAESQETPAASAAGGGTCRCPKQGPWR